MIRKSKKVGTIIYIFLLSISLLIAFDRIKLGMADVDESFYLTIPLRLIQGDALLSEEWNLSQLSAILLYPILKVYLMLFKSTEGIILSFRYIYVVFQTLVSFVTYIVIRKKNEVFAIVLGILFFLFTPFNIMALSYNTMGLMGVWLYTILEVFLEKKSKIICFLEGVILACAVLCNPYLVSIYILNMGRSLYRYLKQQDRSEIHKIIMQTLGVFCVFVVFCYIVFSRTTLADVLNNLPLILTSPAHSDKNTMLFFVPFISFCKDYKLYIIVSVILWIIGGVYKKAREYCFVLNIIVSMGMSLFFAVCMTNGQGYATIMIPLSLLGFYAFSYSEEKDWTLFSGWILGIVYAVCANLASNNGIYVIANACTVSSLISILLIYSYLKRRMRFKNALFLMIGIVSIQFFTQMYVYCNHVFWEEGPEVLTCEIEKGPLKGIITIKEKKELYDENYENLVYIKEKYNIGGKQLLLFKRFPSGYLFMNEMRMGAYSAWMSDIAVDLNDERINIYYEYHPEKTPDFIYIDTYSAGVWEYEQWNRYSKENGYQLEIISNGAYFLWRNEYD